MIYKVWHLRSFKVSRTGKPSSRVYHPTSLLGLSRFSLSSSSVFFSTAVWYFKAVLSVLSPLSGTFLFTTTCYESEISQDAHIKPRLGPFWIAAGQHRKPTSPIISQFLLTLSIQAIAAPVTSLDDDDTSVTATKRSLADGKLPFTVHLYVQKDAATTETINCDNYEELYAELLKRNKHRHKDWPGSFGWINSNIPTKAKKKRSEAALQSIKRDDNTYDVQVFKDGPHEKIKAASINQIPSSARSLMIWSRDGQRALIRISVMTLNIPITSDPTPLLLLLRTLSRNIRMISITPRVKTQTSTRGQPPSMPTLGYL